MRKVAGFICAFVSILMFTASYAHNKVVVIPLFGNDEIVAPPSSSHLSMIIVLDQSGSMNGAYWDAVKIGLSEYFVDPSSSGIGVGMNFFPVDGAVDQCDEHEYSPLQVPFGELTTYAATLINALGNHTPSGLTPTYPALHGSAIVATQLKDANPEEEVIIILITDGDPSGACNNNIAQIASLASSAFNYNGVRTYVVGIQGATVSSLNAIATAGGTGQAYDVTGDVSQFKTKMEEIRTDALGL